jgi:hypothetical protein
MRIYRDQHFETFRDRPRWPWQLAGPWIDLEFHNCQIELCEVLSFLNVRRRPVIRNVQVLNCEVRATLRGALVEDVLVDGLKTPRRLDCWATAFKHVTLRGKIGKIFISPLIEAATQPTKANQAFAQANAAYYASVDWALDIREAEFQEADLRGMPAHLVRRDPDTQIVVTRDKVLQGAWRKLDLSDTWWPGSLELFLSQSDAPAKVLVAPKRHPKFQQLLDGLMKLRDADVAEPD